MTEPTGGEAPLDRPPGEVPPLPPHAEPVVTGTVFIMLVFLMALAGLWGIMYLLLLGR